ncbi:tetratricopeptide repeat protein [Gemmata sp. JC717]|uniref:tetratricopeptide repeat protein n=1 Tax=Gemmata algarum TaxID=2975278 RepID=UPI0021BB176B|nr:tetratricopeptide repeat protein [Gemmata algarum]MDY3554963.1 tetratricopeptide repeat protein [Gemmata algarum]
MDGRVSFRWLAFGCAVAAALGCNRNAVQPSPFGQMPNTTGAPAPAPTATAKSMWGGGSSPAPPPGAVELTPPPSTEPPKAETLVALADVRLDAAFDEKTAPGSREPLLDMAREGYQKALKQDPKSPIAMLGIARFYAKVGEKEKALEAYKKYLTAYPKDVKVAHEVAIAHARWKDWPGAVAWCQFALTHMDPENRDVKKFLGFCQARVGKWDEALATLSQIMPEAQARHNLAGLLDHLGYPEHSKQQLQLATQADPNYVPARDFLTELTQPRGATEPEQVRQASGEQPAP